MMPLTLALILVMLPVSAATLPEQTCAGAELVLDVPGGIMHGARTWSFERFTVDRWTIVGPCDSWYWWNGRLVVKSGDRCGYV
jgi:hypothetical protein